MRRNWQALMRDNCEEFIFRLGNPINRWNEFEYLLQIDSSTLLSLRKSILDSNPDVKKAKLNQDLPSRNHLSKQDYILECIKVFDNSLAYNTTMLESLVKVYYRYSFNQLETAYNWVYINFSELDLGTNTGWYGSSITILKLLRKGLWDKETESRLLKEYLIDTCWFDIIIHK